MQKIDDRTRGPLGTACHTIPRHLFAHVDIAFLVFFRIAFGATMLWHAWRYASKGWIKSFYIDPQFHFTYYGFEWVHPLPGGGMYLHFMGMLALSLGVMLGFYYRLSAILLCGSFSYVFLLEQTRYQNHYYLLALISLLMVFLPAHRSLSIDAVRFPKIRSAVVPAWTLWLLRFQIGVPYFFGGVAKLNADWLHGAPMRILLADKGAYPLIGPYVHQDWMIALFAYGSLVFDLLVVPLLLWRRTRTIAFLLAVAFHLANAALFRIGVFPWFMIAATTVFFSPGWPRNLWQPRRQPAALGQASNKPLSFRQKLTATVLGAYVCVQLLLPLRHHLYPGNADWTEEGARFAWRMMLRSKTVGMRFYATYPARGKTEVVDPRPFLSPRQTSRMGMDPDTILQLSHFLARQLQHSSEDRVEIRAVVLASLNGRKPQLLIDPKINLAARQRTLWHQPWIVPLREPLPDEPWSVPVHQWDMSLDGRSNGPQPGSRGTNE